MSIGTTGAIIGAGVLGAGGAIAGSAIAGGAAKDAAATAAAAQQQAIEAQTRLGTQGLDILRQQNQYAQEQLAPFIAAQRQATTQLQGFTDPSNPLYGQERDQATRQIQQQLAAQGLLRSRAQGDSLANLELGLNQQRVGVIQGLAGNGASQGAAQLAQGYGQGAASVLGGIGQQVGSSFQNLGQIQAQGIMGAGQAAAQGFAGVGNAIQGSLGNILSLKQLAALTGKNLL